MSNVCVAKTLLKTNHLKRRSRLTQFSYAFPRLVRFSHSEEKPKHRLHARVHVCECSSRNRLCDLMKIILQVLNCEAKKKDTTNFKFLTLSVKHDENGQCRVSKPDVYASD